MSTSLSMRRFGSPPPRLFSITAILFNLDIFSPPSRCPAVKTSDFSNPAKLCDLLAPTAALFLSLQHCFLPSKLGFLDSNLHLVFITWEKLIQIMSLSWCGRAMLRSIFSFDHFLEVRIEMRGGRYHATVCLKKRFECMRTFIPPMLLQASQPINTRRSRELWEHKQ